MKLTVLNVAYPLAPVGPDAVGGAEQVLTHLDAALVAAGHCSLVLACDGSVARGELIAFPCTEEELTEERRRVVRRRYQQTLEQTLTEWPVDLVHLHGVDFHEYLPPAGVPVLATLHLPPAWYPPAVFNLTRPETTLNCVSHSQQADCPPAAGSLPVIENGVPVEQLAVQHGKRRYALSLGRVCPEKGFHRALEAAKLARFPWLLGGEVFHYAAHEDYFRDELAPRLDESRRYLGPIGFARKRRLLTAARCLLVSSLVPETSSLVAMESLACGTPVVAFPNGALPDIIEHGRTGFLVQDEREMAAAIHAAVELSPEDCRTSARRRFSLANTCQQYLELYEQLVRRAAVVPFAGR
jgi:glycosyltransferase involved in cell wall biosynthesis